jgi:hypothetical protein
MIWRWMLRRPPEALTDSSSAPLGRTTDLAVMRYAAVDGYLWGSDADADGEKAGTPWSATVLPLHNGPGVSVRVSPRGT